MALLLALIMVIGLCPQHVHAEESPAETHTHSYTDGVCECGEVCAHAAYTDGVCNDCHMTCAHAEYAEGKCTVCGVAEPADEPAPVYGTTTFVYSGSNENISGANLVFYFTWGVSTNNSYPADCGITVSASGKSVTLTVDKNTLTDSTVWLNAWDNVVWTKWNGISTTFSGETYYLTDNGVTTTPPADPDPEPHSHTYPDAYSDGKCTGCGEVCAHAAFTDGVCSDCHMTCTHAEYAEGKCTVCGMDKPAGEPDPEPHSHTYPETYTDGKCTGCGEVCAHAAYTDGVCNDCHMICTHAEYAEGKCTVCGVAEPADEPVPVYGTTTFVYSGSNENISGANLVFYFTWGVSTNNSYPADCGVTVSASGKSVILTVDKNTLTDSTVWLNAWDNVVWTKWDGISTTFSGETYYLSDDGISTTPPADPDPEPHSHTYPEIYTDGKCNGCGEVCAHAAYTDGVCNDCHMTCTHAEYVDGKCAVCGMDEPAASQDIGTTTFVYAGTNDAITAENLVAYITWGTENYNDNAENCGFTVIRNGKTLTLQVDKNILTDAVWMKIWDNVEWTTWDSINPSFTGETYYLTDSGVSTTPPADPDPEPHTHTYVDGICECGEVCAHAEYVDGKCTVCGMDEPVSSQDIGTTIFVYAGSNEAITADNLVAYITWGTEKYNDTAENCGFTVIRDGKTLTLQIDKNVLTDAVWMKIWDDVEWTTWDSINPTFAGETYYLTDSGVSTTPPADPDPEPHVHTYIDGVCECGDVCVHAEYVDGKCTVCGMAEPNPDPVIPEENLGQATFIYEGTNANVTADNLVAYITWGTATYNANAEDCGFTVIRSGNTVILQVDKTTLTDSTVWLKIWENQEWTTWDSISCTFSGETYHLQDGGVYTTGSTGSEDPEPEEAAYQFTVHCYGEGYQIGAWMALVEDGTETAWTPSNESKTAVFSNPEDGWTSAVISWNLTDTYNRLSFQIGEGTPWGSSTYNYDFTTPIGELWIIPGSTVVYTSKEAAEEVLNSENPPAPGETTQYEFTVYCYGEGYQIGAWMALVEDGVEVAWTPSSPAKTAVLGNPEDGWTSAVITWNLADTFNRFGCTIGIDDPWASSKYNYDFTEPSGEIWIVPGDPRVYTSKESALEGMQTEYEPTYSFTVHCKGEGYQIGAWLELVTNGEVTAWTPAEDGITASLENLEDGWTSVTISWDNTETYNRLGFVLGTTDPWVGTRYTYEFDASTGEDVWIVPGYGGAYSTKKAAEANAWSYYYQFKIHCYGEGYQVGAWMAKVVDGEETAWTPAASSVIRSFGNLQDGWTTATVSWSSKTLYNRLGFQIGVDSPWEATKYSYDFTERIGEIWILPDDPTVYLSEEAALEALNNPASAKYSFHIHCYGESYQIGAWMALVRNNEEVAWTADSAAFIGAFEPEMDGWSEVWVKWNLEEDYNRLGFTIGVDDPWASASYSFDFKECPAEIWIVPGDMNIYLSREEAEEAMTPGVEMTIPPETEPSETEPVEVPAQEEEKSGSGVIGIVIGIAAAGGFIWWLILFLRKRKKK